MGSKLLQELRDRVVARGHSRRTAATYAGWVRRYILFHDKRHPRELGAEDLRRFLDHLMLEQSRSAVTHNQALSALRFLYRHVLTDDDYSWVDELDTARRGLHLPEVLSRDEVVRLLGELRGPRRLQASLLYGSGLRLRECLGLRVRDVDLERQALTVRVGKGAKDRQTVLPRLLIPTLRLHLEDIEARHRAELEAGAGWVEVPAAIRHRNAGAGRSWSWQWVFPAARAYTCPRTGHRVRHHSDPSALQRAVKSALLRSGLSKRASCHTLRHSFATHMIEDGCDLPALKELMGHADIKTTMQYIHLAQNGPLSRGSPLDRLPSGAPRFLVDDRD